MPEHSLHRVVLSLGSNEGRREEHILGALRAIEFGGDIRLVATSSLYETDPVGSGYGRRFVNAACVVETALRPRSLLERCSAIERRFGRRSDARSVDRPLDIDIVLFGDAVIDEPGLAVPHRELRNRRFVLEPLCEIAPDLAVPPDGRSVGELLAALAAGQLVRRISARSSIKQTS